MNERAEEISMDDLIEGQRKLNEAMQRCLEMQRHMLRSLVREQKQIIQEVRTRIELEP